MAVFSHNTVRGLSDNVAPLPFDSTAPQDDLILLERVDRRELDLIETAILQMLIDNGSESALKHEEIAKPKAHWAGSKGDADFSMCCSPAPQKAAFTHKGDFDLLTKLLKQIQLLKSQKCDSDFLWKHQRLNSQSEQLSLPGHLQADAQTRGIEVRDATEAAVKAAMAAADAAKAAAVSISKNSEAIQSLLKTLTPSPSPSADTESTSFAVPLQTHEENAKDNAADKSKGKEKDIAKVLERQNRITHWILGFMVLATSIWRFKLVSLVLNFQRKVNHPLESLGDLFSEGSKDHQHHKNEGLNSRALQFPHLELPPIFQSTETEANERSVLGDL